MSRIPARPSTTYAVRWCHVWSVVLLLLLVPSPVLLAWGALVGFAFVGAGTGAVVALVLWPGSELPLGAGLRQVRRFAAWGAAGVAAVSVASRISGWATLLLLALLVLTSPVVVGRLGRARPQPPAPLDLLRSVGATSPGSTAVVLEQLSDRDLCQVWRSGHHHLLGAGSTAEALACVRLRQLVLDELDARHPEAVAAWLATDAEAAGGPEAHLPVDPRDNAA